MKKIFLSVAAVMLVFCFTVVVMPGFAGATDMDHGMMMDNGKMMMDNGKMMMKHGRMMMKKADMGEGKMMEKKEMMEKHDVKDMNK